MDSFTVLVVQTGVSFNSAFLSEVEQAIMPEICK